MNAAQDRAADRFLSQLDRELGILPAAQRNDIIEDVEAHINDALDAGRGIDEILAGLGTPREAAKAYADELGSYAAETGGRQPVDPVGRVRRWLAITAMVVGVLTAACLPIVEPDMVDALGVGGAILLFTVPVILGALPLALPQRWATVVAGAAAIVSTAIVVTAFFVSAFPGGNLIMLTALMAVLWALALAPVAARTRESARLAWRIVGGVLVAAPGALLVASGWQGTIELTVTVVIIGAVMLALGVLMACGWLTAYTAVLAAGAALMIGSLFDVGLLTWGIWTVGGLWIALGVAALAGSRPRA